jgi:adenylate cyclase
VRRSEYTAVGDTVNLAARLETITKDFASPIIISEATYALVKHEIRARPLGEVTVKGKEIPVKIYAPLAAASRPEDRADGAAEPAIAQWRARV